MGDIGSFVMRTLPLVSGNIKQEAQSDVELAKAKAGPGCGSQGKESSTPASGLNYTPLRSDLLNREERVISAFR